MYFWCCHFYWSVCNPSILFCPPPTPSYKMLHLRLCRKRNGARTSTIPAPYRPPSLPQLIFHFSSPAHRMRDVSISCQSFPGLCVTCAVISVWLTAGVVLHCPAPSDSHRLTLMMKGGGRGMRRGFLCSRKWFSAQKCFTERLRPVFVCWLFFKKKQNFEYDIMFRLSSWAKNVLLQIIHQSKFYNVYCVK